MTGKIRHPDILAQRERAHAAFDLLHLQGWMSKDDAYAWLSGAMGIPPAEAHIGRMSLEQCEHTFAMASHRLRVLAEHEQGKFNQARRLLKRIGDQATLAAAAFEVRPLTLGSIAEQCRAFEAGLSKRQKDR